MALIKAILKAAENVDPDDLARVLGLADEAPAKVPAPPPAPRRPARAQTGGRSTIRGAERKLYPGIYQDPRALLEQASARVASPDDALTRLFGVTREDLSAIGKSRKGNQEPFLPGAAKKPKGTKHAGKVTKPANTQRLLDALENARGTPLEEGMTGWYVMDPAYQRLAELVGPEEAARRYTQFNTATGISSANADVVTELARGTGALKYFNEGRYDDFVQYGGGENTPGRPADMAGIPGHMGHKTSHGVPMTKFFETGDAGMKSPKVPLYIQAAGVPETGFQTAMPVGDAHFSRAIGLPDVRPARYNKDGDLDVSASWSTPEAQELTPWWRDEVAGKVDLESVPAQALAWGLFSPQTGVQSSIASPKLEILAGQIMKTAKRLGISPEAARDRVLMGKEYAGAAAGAGVLGAAGLQSEEAEAGAPSALLRQLNEMIARGGAEIGGRSLLGAPNTPNIPGAGPMRVGQNPEAVRAAEDYARRQGIEYTPLENYVQVDPERGSRIARAYERMPHNPDDPRTAAAYKALADETLDQYDNMLSAGIEPYFIRGDDPYAASPYLSLLDLAENKRLGVFPTDAGFGTDEAFDVSGNPLLAESPLSLGGAPARVNDIFRAVHDFYGHAKPGVGFRAKGEENAYQSHAGMYSPQARPAAATETRGQNSWLNFGPYGKTNRTAGIDDTVFADQKTGLLPNWAVNEGLETVPRPPVSPDLLPAVDERGMIELTHYGRKPLDVIDPNQYGSGLSGRTIAERNRRHAPDFVNRSYYGIQKGVDRPYRQEGGLGNEAHTASLSADLLYDAKGDPSGVWKGAGGGTSGEKAVRDAGFSGYWADDPKLGKVAVVFDPLEARRLKESGFADPIMLAGAAAAGAGATAAQDPSLLDTANQYSGYVLDALETPLNALEMPQRGLLGLMELGGSMASGAGFDESLNRAANTARRPVDETAYELGGRITDETGSPEAGLLAYLAALAAAPF